MPRHSDPVQPDELTDGYGDSLRLKTALQLLAVLVALGVGALTITDVLPGYLGALVLIVTTPITFWLDYRKRRRRYAAEVRAQQKQTGRDQESA